VTCASPSSPALAFFSPRLIAATGCGKGVAHQGLLQVKRAVETVGFQSVADAAARPFHHSVSLGPLGRRKAMLDAKFGAELVELMVAGRYPGRYGKETVSELFPVVGQYPGNPDWAGPAQIPQELASIRAVLAGPMRTNTQRVARSMAMSGNLCQSFVCPTHCVARSIDARRSGAGNPAVKGKTDVLENLDADRSDLPDLSLGRAGG